MKAWSASHPCRFTPGIEVRLPIESWSGQYGEVKILDPTGTQTPTPRSSSPWSVTIQTTLPQLFVYEDKASNGMSRLWRRREYNAFVVTYNLV
jgi:hypothetical protein